LGLVFSGDSMGLGTNQQGHGCYADVKNVASTLLECDSTPRLTLSPDFTKIEQAFDEFF